MKTRKRKTRITRIATVWVKMERACDAYMARGRVAGRFDGPTLNALDALNERMIRIDKTLRHAVRT